MVVEMLNVWYFVWLVIAAGAIVGLYFLLKNQKPSVQKIVLFSLLAAGFLLHFLKMFIPPYSVDEARLLSDIWFINICGANIALFPFLFWMKKKPVKDYMFYIGVLSGLIALFYPQEALGKGGSEMLDVIRFYYHHWMLLAVPLLMVLLKQHKLSWKRVWAAPVGLLLLMLFIILNQFFQSELGFIPLRGAVDKLQEIDGVQYILTKITGAPIDIGGEQYALVNYWDIFRDVDWKNSSYIYSPNFTETAKDPIGAFFDIFCPGFFKTVPVGAYAGQTKYWPWFWMIFPVFILVTPLSFGLSMIFDRKNFVKDVKGFTWKGFLAVLLTPFKKMKARIFEDDVVAEIAGDAEITDGAENAVEEAPAPAEETPADEMVAVGAKEKE